MLTRRCWLSAVISTMLISASAWADQQTIDQMSHFGVKVAVEDNFAGQHGVNCAASGGDWGACYQATITLTNPGAALQSHDWAIWFSGIRQVLATDNDQFRITHVVGDLHKIEPTETFRGFPAGGSIVLPVINEYWQLSLSDVLPRWYVTSSQGTPKVIAATATENLSEITTLPASQWKRTPDDANILMTAENRYLKNQLTSPVPAAELRGHILPTPRSVEITAGNVSLKQGIAADLRALPADSANVITEEFREAGVRTDGSYPVITAIDPAGFKEEGIKEGAYRLKISQERAEIIGYDSLGVFNGLQSLKQLIPATGEPLIPVMNLSDSPRFAYRAIFIDVARNFHSKAAILRTLQQMSRYKLNILHLHLSDDEGWRIEIPGLPELTSVGANRCHDVSETRCLLPQLGSGPDTSTTGSGYFSREDYIEILRYANARQITVIPEIDMPAHARAAVISMEARYKKLMAEGKVSEANQYRLQEDGDDSSVTTVQYYDRTSFINPCLPSAQRFVSKIMNELIAMHREAGQPLETWHFGGDEAKNIYLGPGYTDKNHPQPGKGQRDLSLQDKPWAKSASCRQRIQQGEVGDFTHLPGWFALQVSQLVQSAGLKNMQAWQDGLKAISSASEFATGTVALNFWDPLYWDGVNSAGEWAEKGYRIIVSSPDYLYLDMPYEVDPQEPGYYWATRFSDEQKIFTFSPDNLPMNAETSTDRDGKAFSATGQGRWPGAAGMSAQVWSEIVRTDEQMEYRLYPRLLAVAERAWHKADWELPYQPGLTFEKGKTTHVNQQQLQADWNRFATLLGRSVLPTLDTAGISYRIPVPGARIRNGVLEANTSLPGVRIEYSTDEGQHWMDYQEQQPPAVTGKILVRSRSSDGLRSGREVSLQAD